MEDRDLFLCRVNCLDNRTFYVSYHIREPSTFHPRVVRVYDDRGYDDYPETEKEFLDYKSTLKEGETSLYDGWNGIATSLKFEVEGDGTLDGTMQTMRYNYLRAARSVLKEVDKDSFLSDSDKRELYEQISPNLFGTSLIVPVVDKGLLYLAGHQKGRGVVNANKVHAVLSGGGFEIPSDNKKGYVSGEDIMDNMLRELKEEVGIDGDVGLSDYLYLSDDRQAGNVNLVFVSNERDVLDLECILYSFVTDCREKIERRVELETQGIVTIPIYDFGKNKIINPLVSDNDSDPHLSRGKWYKFVNGGIDEQSAAGLPLAPVSPENIINYFTDEDKVDGLMDSY